VVLRDRGTYAENEEEGDIGGGTPEVNGPASEPGSEKPGTDVGDELKTRVDKIELKGTVA
jgi:hypothetical protein